MNEPRTHAKDILLLFLGVFACSTSVIFIKQSTVHPALVPAYRLAIAALVMLPMFLRQARQQRGWFTRGYVVRLLIAAVLLAVHFVTWTAGARMTLAANGTLLVNLAPVIMPFILYFQLREKLNRREFIGTAIVLVGIVWLGAGDYQFDRRHLHGDLVCFVSMLLYTFYLAAARANRGIPGIWLYVVPLYALAAAMSLALALPVTKVFQIYSAREYALLLALALIPTVTGHTLLNYSMRKLRGQLVTLASASQFIFAGIQAALFLGEKPRIADIPPAALVFTGCMVVILSTPRPSR